MVRLSIVGESMFRIWGGVMRRITEGRIAHFGQTLLADRARATGHVSENHSFSLTLFTQKTESR